MQLKIFSTFCQRFGRAIFLSKACYVDSILITRIHRRSYFRWTKNLFIKLILHVHKLKKWHKKYKKICLTETGLQRRARLYIFSMHASLMVS